MRNTVLGKLIFDCAEELQFRVVDFALTGGKTKTLQIFIEKEGYKPVTLEECTKYSRALSIVLDVENPINSHYILEVSSPGIDRPLTNVDDFKEFIGKNIRVKFYEPWQDSLKAKGKLTKVENSDITIELLNGELGTFSLDNVKKARLDILDQLFNK